MNKMDEFSIRDTKIRFDTSESRHEFNSRRRWRNEQYRHYSYFYRILHMLADEGFKVEKNPEVLKNYRIISRDHWYGRRDDLEFEASKFPAGFEIIFFQNINFENPNGGKYDFDKLEKMPYLIRLQYIVYMRKIVEKLKTLTDVKDKTVPASKNAEEKIKIDLAYGWGFFPDTNFDLLVGNRVPDDSYYGLDRDKKPIRNGDLKYFRNRWNGYIMRGRVYYRANMSWWAIVNKWEAVVVNNYDLFDDFPSGEPARLAPDRTPKEYRQLQEKREKAKMAALELIGDLECRGVKIPKKVKRACVNEICRKQSADQ